MTETEWRAELRARTTEALGRFGVAGRVEVESHLVWLIGHGPTVEVALTEADVVSAGQSQADLKRIAERLARELSAARRRSAGQSGRNSNWIEWFKLLPPIGLIAIGIWAAVHYLLPHHATAPPPTAGKKAVSHRGPQSQTPPISGKQILDAESCSRTVGRIQQGGSVTPLDTDGWVIELSLISDQPDLNPADRQLDEHFTKRVGNLERSNHSAQTPVLNGLTSAQSGLLISKEPLASAVPNGQSGILITWRGQYVAAYFQPNDRTEYLHLADTLFQELHAKYGALYARCAQGTARYLGSWYRGPDIASALVMLLAEMEIFADVPQIPNLTLSDGPTAWSVALSRLAEVLHPVTRRRATLLLSSTGGSISERPGLYATVQFPISPGNRANIASSSLARKAWARTYALPKRVGSASP